jgi:DNA-binding LacI/PurR family transcriptional regulator
VNKRTSIKDIARAARVSYSTVSRALRNSELVNPETRARVARWAEKLDYSANSIARGLVTRQTRTVGLVVTTIADPFLGEVVDGIENVALDQGYSLLLSNGHSEPERELAIIRQLQERRVDGIVVIATRMARLHMERLQRLQVPIVLINNLNPLEANHQICSVSIDNASSSRAAVEHLLSLGHRRIGFISDEVGDQSNRDRRSGYVAALEAAGLEPDADSIAQADGTAAGGARAAERLVAGGARFTALFCYNDMTAVGAMKTLRHAGLEIPRDVSIVGFDDIQLSSYLDLTTVRQPKFEMGRRAMEMMLKLIGGGAVVSSLTLPGELVVRGSTAPPA